MTRPTDIYATIPRDLLENFLYQHQDSVVRYEDSLGSGFGRGISSSLTYTFDCPSDTAASGLKAYLLEQVDHEIRIAKSGAGWQLTGTADEVDYDLALILKTVGYWCDAGSQFNCRFDGWTAAQGRAEETASADVPGPIELPPDIAEDPTATQRAAIWSAQGREYYLIRRGAFAEHAAWGMIAVDLMRHAARAHEAKGRSAGEVYQEILAGFMAELKNPTD